VIDCFDILLYICFCIVAGVKVMPPMMAKTLRQMKAMRR